MDPINFEQFEAVDIRIGTVKKADVPEWSHWVIRMEVDFGPEIGTKKAFSGIMKFFKPEDLLNKQFPFVIKKVPDGTKVR
ncbi:MAG: Methionyl-tRNA synthetase [Candidatus Woesebacteria bacterium GW2011_GWA2_40_7b]|uniref:Methionyl-tRNA synthetase n=1 Tax=Candidatus Woesebacteria bacterium GW2011_GWA2_40_7b TaxID=1618563 RepID=A0A0G0SZ87_9BACT|nr:MAG: Methionyl-tRNA synthetase [Candidatus Woesebacteria bacterium GW2011_GWA2_40_7b]